MVRSYSQYTCISFTFSKYRLCNTINIYSSQLIIYAIIIFFCSCYRELNFRTYIVSSIFNVTVRIRRSWYMNLISTFIISNALYMGCNHGLIGKVNRYRIFSWYGRSYGCIRITQEIINYLALTAIHFYISQSITLVRMRVDTDPTIISQSQIFFSNNTTILRNDCYRS